jgi:hypothetical protein
MLVFAFLPAAELASAAEAAWTPSLYVMGTFDERRGEAFSAPELDRRHAAPSLGVGLDGRGQGEHGQWLGSLFTLVHDPATSAQRGFVMAGRVRGTRELGPSWRLTLEDSAKLLRRDQLELPGFERNEVVMGLERRVPGEPRWGLQLADRRRHVGDEPRLGFSRQSLAASVGFELRPGRELVLSAAAQRFRADTARGHRLASSLEWLKVSAQGVVALRLAWVEPLGTRDSTLRTNGGPTPPTTTNPPWFIPSEDPPPVDPPTVDPPTMSEPSDGLLGESLFVDPIENDGDDWDFGRRKQEAVGIVSRRLGERATLGLLVRATRERGPDLLNPDSLEPVKEERILTRLSLWHHLKGRAAVVVQLGWQARRDLRPASDFSRLVVAAGVQIRP